ncbi:hypothetical protein TNCV_2895651 [Trichonephila clavipes]|nr:hypothetical protein TNCV_2895651 [Trichonephila clavipes]
MFLSGGQSDAKAPSVKFSSKLGTHLSTHRKGERLSRSRPTRAILNFWPSGRVLAYHASRLYVRALFPGWCVTIDGACLTEETDASVDGGRIASKKEWRRVGQKFQMCGRAVWHRCIQEGPERAIHVNKVRANRTLRSLRAVGRLLWACNEAPGACSGPTPGV